MIKVCFFAFHLAFLLRVHSAVESPKAIIDERSPRHLKPRIIGGTQADAARYPFYTWLNINNGFGSDTWCGGSLITNEVVLTAAHCITFSSYYGPTEVVVDAWVN